MAPYRKSADDIENVTQAKNLRTQESLSQLGASIANLDEKARDAQVEVNKWKALLDLLIGPNRKDKRPDINWDAHIIELVGDEIQPIPTPLLGDGLTFQDVILKVSVHINTLETRANRFKGSYEKTKQRQEKQLKTIDKKEDNLKRKADALLENPGVMDEKIQEKKSLGR